MCSPWLPTDHRDRKGFLTGNGGETSLVVVHTLWSELGGEGHVETGWLQEVLRQHDDARYKFVAGHHPVFPVNGFSGAYQREIGPEHSSEFWEILVEHGVQAYLCSHILAFDVQVHRGVLQITTAGAGTAHRMPEGIEYLHAVQMTVDEDGLRYQVLDPEGRVRERLAWPLRTDTTDRQQLPVGGICAPFYGVARSDRLLLFNFQGIAASVGTAAAQTLLSTQAGSGADLASLWIGLAGPAQRLTVVLSPEPGRSPHTWYGPAFRHDAAFNLDLSVHTGMGPGGFLMRLDKEEPWSSLTGSSPWGAERLPWPENWSIGHGQCGPEDRPFLGEGLSSSFKELSCD